MVLVAHSLVWELGGEGISVSKISFKYLKLSQSQKARVGKGRWWFVLHSHTSLSSRGQLQRRPNKSLRNVFVRLCARPNPAPTAPTCTKGGLYSRPRRVCVWGASSSIPMQGLAKPSQLCNQSFTCGSQQPSAYALLRLSRIFILRGIFIVMGELDCNSAVFCYFELVVARESNPSRICLLQRFKSQSLILAPVPRKKSYK